MNHSIDPTTFEKGWDHATSETIGLCIYRCFVIWGHSVGAVAVPTLMLFTTAALGYSADYGDIVSSAFYIDVRVPLAAGLATNVVLLGLTAGRIWWIRRDACVLESAFLKRYNTAIAIVLESGAIYCIGTVLFIVAGPTVTQATLSPHHLVSGSTSPIAAIFEASLPQILNIVPMLTIVRVGLGRSIGDSAPQHGRQGVPRARVARCPERGLGGVAASSVVIDIGTVRDCEESTTGHLGKELLNQQPDFASP
ncbi:hypothetical protein DFH06DRAFT_1306651 [Mycena polygramma]|nr:hypothetical protein DFH06DRAFT_1306651 [Mycena polygramma]